jgi:glycosyltransferase involved in cell wall biosynthesis
MVIPALHELWRRHPDEFELEIVGVTDRQETIEALSELPAQVIDPPPEEQEYPLFQLWFSSHVDWDIAIAPLIDTPFDRCKSDIKFLDYSAIGAAGIYSRVAAYESSVEHLKTGWLVDNQVQVWTDALQECLNNPELRIQISRNARHYLYNERILARTTENWRAALNKVIELAS